MSPRMAKLAMQLIKLAQKPQSAVPGGVSPTPRPAARMTPSQPRVPRMPSDHRFQTLTNNTFRVQAPRSAGDVENAMRRTRIGRWTTPAQGESQSNLATGMGDAITTLAIPSYPGLSRLPRLTRVPAEVAGDTLAFDFGFDRLAQRVSDDYAADVARNPSEWRSPVGAMFQYGWDAARHSGAAGQAEDERREWEASKRYADQWSRSQGFKDVYDYLDQLRQQNAADANDNVARMNALPDPGTGLFPPEPVSMDDLDPLTADLLNSPGSGDPASDMSELATRELKSMLGGLDPSLAPRMPKQAPREVTPSQMQQPDYPDEPGSEAVISSMRQLIRDNMSPERHASLAGSPEMLNSILDFYASYRNPSQSSLKNDVDRVNALGSIMSRLYQVTNGGKDTRQLGSLERAVWELATGPYGEQLRQRADAKMTNQNAAKKLRAP